MSTLVPLQVVAYRLQFDIYEKHFAIDFPFLHKRAFLSSVQQRQAIPTPGFKTEQPVSMPHQYHPPLLLAFLTQTARYHDKLVEQIDPKNPIATATFYAEATRRQMGINYPGLPTLEKIQALLMLGYYEYTSLQGTEGWVKIGTAIRCAQVLGYQWDADRDHLKPNRAKQNNIQLSDKDQFIIREIQRRTLWSCCLLDRYMSWGKDRPSMIRIDELKAQLVCSDAAFNFGRKVRTRLLGETDEEYKRRRAQKPRINKLPSPHQPHQMKQHAHDIKWEVGHEEADLSWYIQIVEHFGKISKWSSQGGRL